MEPHLCMPIALAPSESYVPPRFPVMSARQSQAIGILSPAIRASSKHDGVAPLEASTAGGIRAVLVHIDDPWFSRMRGRKGFQKEVLGCLCISGRAQPKIERLSLRINGPIQVQPLFFDLDVSLIHPPGVRCRLQMGTASPIKLRRIRLDRSGR